MNVEKQYRRTNLLQEHDYYYNLQDVAEPVLFRDSFPYDQVPKTRFNHRLVPMHFPDHIWITDTTFRDGQQAMEPFTPEQILHLYKLMHRLGGKHGIIRQSEFFVYTEKDRKALEKCMEMDYDFPEITTWIRASKNDFELVKRIGIQETGILVSCSDYHIFNKMGLTRRWTNTWASSRMRSPTASGRAVTWRISPGRTSTALSSPLSRN